MGVSETSWIAGLLVVALVVSALGTLTAIGKFSPTGLPTGQTNASVTANAVISLTTTNVNFGAVTINTTYNTSTDSPAPFVVQNDGSGNVNVTIASTALWSGHSKANSDYQFMCGSTAEVGTCPEDSTASWTDMVGTKKIFGNLTARDDIDTLQAEIQIHVPEDESPEQKNATVTFTASLA